MKQFEFEPLPLPKGKDQAREQPMLAASQQNTTRMCVDAYPELVEKLKDYSYWEGLTQQEVILQSIEHFLKDKPIKSRPAALKNRPKLGRKRKH